MPDRDPHRIKRDIAGLAALNTDARDHIAHIDAEIASLTHRRDLIARVIHTRNITIDRYLDELLEAAR
jgi:hypothetical protein